MKLFLGDSTDTSAETKSPVYGACRVVHPVTNKTEFKFWTYGTEQAFHEMLLQSRHRTFDPMEADLFYIPVYMGCYSWPTFGWTWYPFFNPTGPTSKPWSRMRSVNMAYMAVAAKRWVQVLPAVFFVPKI